MQRPPFDDATYPDPDADPGRERDASDPEPTRLEESVPLSGEFGRTLPLGSKLPNQISRPAVRAVTKPVATPASERGEGRSAEEPAVTLDGITDADRILEVTHGYLPDALRPQPERILPSTSEQAPRPVYPRMDRPAGAPATTPEGGWGLVGFVFSALLATAGIAYFGKVEVTTLAHGKVLVVATAEPALSRAAGTIAQLMVRVGDNVSAGQPIARLDTTELEAQRQRSEEVVQLLKLASEQLDANSAKLELHELETLRNQRAELALRTAQTRNTRTKERLTQELAALDQRLSERQRDFDARLHARDQDLRVAIDALAAATSALELATLRAPVAGTVDALFVSEGNPVEKGTELGRVLPADAVTTLVAFVPAADARFIDPGSRARVELSAHSTQRLGRAQAHVLSVGRNAAPTQDVQAILGVAPSETLMRLELSLDRASVSPEFAAQLAAGEPVAASVNTRSRRVLTVVVDSVRRWYRQAFTARR